ncbi:MAG: hypothetical protein LBN08_05655 [Lactobacillales bacterium]|nr:hypothetical protein [Lactobacillales bacterium]
MQFEVNREKLTIMGVEFRNFRDFCDVFSVLSSSLIEGHIPTAVEVEQMKKFIASKRLTIYNS